MYFKHDKHNAAVEQIQNSLIFLMKRSLSVNIFKLDVQNKITKYSKLPP